MPSSLAPLSPSFCRIRKRLGRLGSKADNGFWNTSLSGIWPSSSTMSYGTHAILSPERSGQGSLYEPALCVSRTTRGKRLPHPIFSQRLGRGNLLGCGGSSFPHARHGARYDRDAVPTPEQHRCDEQLRGACRTSSHSRDAMETLPALRYRIRRASQHSCWTFP